MREQVGDVTSTIIPATLGWSVAMYIEAGEENGEKWNHYFCHDEIIAWEIRREVCRYHQSTSRAGETYVWRETSPITTECGNLENTANIYALRTPSGAFIFPEDTRRENEEEALKYCEFLAKRRKDAS